MKYIVIELQTQNDIVSNIVTSYDSKERAESAYYAVLSTAAISSVPVHAAVLITEEGYPLMSGHYKHEQSVTEDESTEQSI